MAYKSLKSTGPGPISYNTGLACTLVYPEGDNTLCTFCQCIIYTVHSITTVLLNRTISVKIGMNIVTEVMFRILLFIKKLYIKISMYIIIYIVLISVEVGQQVG